MAASDPRGEQQFWRLGLSYQGVLKAGAEAGGSRFWVRGQAASELYPLSSDQSVIATAALAGGFGQFPVTGEGAGNAPVTTGIAAAAGMALAPTTGFSSPAPASPGVASGGGAALPATVAGVGTAVQTVIVAKASGAANPASAAGTGAAPVSVSAAVAAGAGSPPVPIGAGNAPAFPASALSGGSALQPVVNSANQDVVVATAIAAARAVDPSPITLRVTVSMGAGGDANVAPRVVHFSAKDTISGETTRPFDDLCYEWDFGDTGSSGSGNWDTWSGSMPAFPRNGMFGTVVEHTYEAPGTFIWKCWAFNPITKSRAFTSGLITVLDPDVVYAGANTVCFANGSGGSTFAGAPAGCTQVGGSTSLADMNSYIASGKRLLFKRGDSWTVSASPSISIQGHMTIAAFGSGAKPVWNLNTGTSGAPIRAGVLACTGLRIMDIDLHGQGHDWVGVLKTTGKTSDLLLLRVVASQIGGAAGVNAVDLSDNVGAGTLNDICCFQECDFNDLGGGSGGGDNWYYLFCRRLSLLGCSAVDTVDAEHICRVEYAQDSVIAFCRFKTPGSLKSCLLIRGVEWWRGSTSGSVGINQWTEDISIYGCLFEDANTFHLQVAPSGDTQLHRIRRVIVNACLARVTKHASIVYSLQTFDSTLLNCGVAIIGTVLTNNTNAFSYGSSSTALQEVTVGAIAGGDGQFLPGESYSATGGKTGTIHLALGSAGGQLVYNPTVGGAPASTPIANGDTVTVGADSAVASSASARHVTGTDVILAGTRFFHLSAFLDDPARTIFLLNVSGLASDWLLVNGRYRNSSGPETAFANAMRVGWRNVSGTTTVTHPRHGYQSGQIVVVANSTNTGLVANGNKNITVIDADHYTFTATGGDGFGELKATNASGPVLESNNDVDTSGYSVVPVSAATDFQLSSALGGGIEVPVWTDMGGRERPVGIRETGAWEFGAVPPTPPEVSVGGVKGTGDAVVAAGIASAAAVAIQPTAIAAGTASPPPAQGTGTANAPTATGTGTASVSGGVAQGAASVPAPVGSGAGAAAVTTAAAQGAGLVPAPAVAGAGAAPATAGIALGGGTVPAPAGAAVGDAPVSAGAAQGAGTVPAPTVTGAGAAPAGPPTAQADGAAMAASAVGTGSTVVTASIAAASAAALPARAKYTGDVQDETFFEFEVDSERDLDFEVDSQRELDFELATTHALEFEA